MSEIETGSFRKRSRSRSEWLDIVRSFKMRDDVTDYERQLVRYALRLRDDFPIPEREIKRVIEAKEVMNTYPSQENFQSLNLDRIFKDANNERSLNYLKNLKAPENYNPNPSLEQLKISFKKNNYFISEDDIFTIHQAIISGRAIKVDGAPGVGKTELSKQIAIAMGLDINNPLHFGELFITPDISKEEAFYRWNDALRLTDMQLVSGFSSRMSNEDVQKVYEQVSEKTYSPRYLDLQVLIRSCVIPYRTVCLIDEIDKSYHEFDNYLLDIVDHNRFVIPEYGRIGREKHNPETSPIFVLTSNMTRALSGPLVRRCRAVFYDYLDETLEAKVVHAKTGINILEAGKIASFFKKIRKHEKLRLQKPPSTAEVVETASAIFRDKLPITEQNLFKMHGSWIKFRVDYIAISELFLRRDGTWSEVI